VRQSSGGCICIMGLRIFMCHNNPMERITSNRLFPLQLWLLTTVVVGPILLSMGNALSDSGYFKNSANIGVTFLFIPFGLFFSFPTFAIVWLTYSLMEKRLSPFLMKLLLMGVAIIGVIVTFSLIDGSMAKTYSLLYSASIGLSSLILRVTKS
jgi:hypothetical protein